MGYNNRRKIILFISVVYNICRTFMNILWCIIIQWNKETKLYYCRRIIEHVADVLQREGPDSWWTLPEENLLPPEIVENFKQNEKPLPTKVLSLI